jgi:hypothetical protein
MSKRMSDADIEKALRSTAASYERNLTGARKQLKQEMEGIRVYVGTLDTLIRSQELAAVWRLVLTQLDDHTVTASTHLDLFRLQAQEILTVWEPSQSTSDIHRIEDKAMAAAWRRFLKDTKGMI